MNSILFFYRKELNMKKNIVDFIKKAFAPKPQKINFYLIDLVSINKNHLKKLNVGEIVFLEADITESGNDVVEVYHNDIKIGKLPKKSPYGFDDNVRYAIINYLDDENIRVGLITSNVYIKRADINTNNFISGDLATINRKENKVLIYCNGIEIDELQKYTTEYIDEYLLNPKTVCSVLQKNGDKNYIYSIIFK